MKLRNPRVIAIIAKLAAIFLWIWLSMVRFRYREAVPHTHPRNKPKDRYIYCFWHENILVPARYFGQPDIYLLQSLHADGELMTKIAAFFGFSNVRGSTSKGGMKAARDLLRIAEHSHMALTPDGPKGPRRVVSVGVIYIASRSGKPIVPFAIGYSKAWRAKSWDRMAIPRPLSKAFCIGGAPIHVPADLDSAGLEEYRLIVEKEMHRLDELSERWAREGPAFPNDSPE